MIFMAFEAFIPQVGAFFLVFAIVLGLLTSTKLFGRNVNAAIAVVFGLFSAIYEPFVSGAQTYLPLAAVVLVVIFFLVLVKRLVGGGVKGDLLPFLVVIASLLIVLGAQAERVLAFLPGGFDTNNMLWVIGIVLVFILFWAAYAHGKSNPIKAAGD